MDNFLNFDDVYIELYFLKENSHNLIVLATPIVTPFVIGASVRRMIQECSLWKFPDFSYNNVVMHQGLEYIYIPEKKI